LLAPIKIEQMNIDLDEIQDIDPHKIIKHKLNEAFKHHKGPFIVEDSGLVLRAFGGKLPGPFIKFFNVYLGPKNLAKLAIGINEQRAEGRTIIAYAKNKKNILFFEGTIKGRVVMPRGKHGFGYDPIFLPNNSKFTLGELKSEGYYKFSARGIAAKKLKNYLLSHEK
jgi:non-canonical purine NTP pyrophosphatase (RdgB/HAM1 family)